MKTNAVIFTTLFVLIACCNNLLSSEKKEANPTPLVQYQYTYTFGGPNCLQVLEDYLKQFPSYQRCSLCRKDIFIQTLNITLQEDGKIKKESIYSCQLITDQPNFAAPEPFQQNKLLFTTTSQLHEWIYPHTKHFPSELPITILLYAKDDVKNKFLALHVFRKIILDGKTILPQSEIEPEPTKPVPIIKKTSPNQQLEKTPTINPQPEKKDRARVTLLKIAGLVAFSAAVIWNFDQLKTYLSQFMSQFLPGLFVQK